MKGSLGVQPKEHLIRLEQEEMAGSSVVGASPVTYAAAAAASVSGNAAGAGTPPATPVVISDEETKQHEDFAQWKRWDDMRKASDGSTNAGAVSIAGPRHVSSMSL